MLRQRSCVNPEYHRLLGVLFCNPQVVKGRDVMPQEIAASVLVFVQSIGFWLPSARRASGPVWVDSVSTESARSEHLRERRMNRAQI